MGDEDGDYCVNCNTAIAGGMLLDLCKTGAVFSRDDKKAGISCKSLKKDFEKGRITAGKLLTEVRSRMSNKEHLKELDMICSVLKENGVNLEDK